MAVTEKLISIVRKYPILYDLDHEDYRNLRKKNKVWEHIGRELHENGEKLKKKWKNLRDSYAKHLKSFKTNDEVAIRKYYRWQWTKHMEIYRPFMTLIPPIKTDLVIRGRDTETTVMDIDMESKSPIRETENEDSTSDIEEKIDFDYNDIKIPATIPVTGTTLLMNEEKINPSIRITKNEDSREDSCTKTVTNYLKDKTKHNESNMDAIDLIFSGYAQTVKNFSPRLQVMAKLKFAQLLSELELEQQQE